MLRKAPCSEMSWFGPTVWGQFWGCLKRKKLPLPKAELRDSWLAFSKASCPPLGTCGEYSVPAGWKWGLTEIMSINGSAYLLNCVRFFAAPWTVACQGPRSMGFSRQEYWSGLPFPPPWDVPGPGTEPTSLVSPALQVDFYRWAIGETPRMGLVPGK